MQEASVTRFKRFDGTGESVEYRTKDRGYLLAYIDYSGDGTGAACTVYSPSTSRGHYYAERPAKKAEAIVERHLNTEGYTSVTGEGE
jgi:hypothetical protein